MKIKLKLSASETSKSDSVTTEELGYTQEEWGKLNQFTKQELIKEYVYDLPEQPYWALDEFDEG